MRDSFDAGAYARYVRRRWRFVSAVCGLSLVLTIGVSLLLPKRYTATASILIEAPAGNDVRTATAVSPVYLESLRTYEYFAGNDTLFRKALDHFHLRDSAAPGSIESLKRRVLRVNKVRDTRILEISATLEDPKLAQAFVQFLAEQTLALNQELAQAGDRDLVQDAARQQADAKRQLETLQAEWTDLELRAPTAALRTEVDELAELKMRVKRDLLDAQAAVTEFEHRPDPEGRAGSERARASTLARQEESLSRDLQRRSELLAKRARESEVLRSQLRAAESAFEAASSRLRDVRSSSGFRGERLRIVDPGIPPERPSSPNIPLNCVVALVTAFLGSLLYLGMRIQFAQVPAREAFRTGVS